MFSLSLIPDAFARAFAPVPSEPLWDWADRNVWLETKEAAEAGPYRSAKTPWTRRLQELIQKPEMFCYDYTRAAWTRVRVTETDHMKSSQSGFTEACLNGIRFCANYRPRNVIYNVDTRETAADISERLLPSLRKLDGDIFTGDDDEVGTYTMRLRAMDIWFQGSFSTGKFASKQAPLVFADEVEEHGTNAKDTSTATALKSRKKTANDGLQVVLCKPRRKNGPIHRGFMRGNQERFHIRCPHCAHYQPLSFRPEEYETPFSEDLDEIRDEQTGRLLATVPRPLPRGEIRKVTTGRLVFDHCKDMVGGWDKLRILSEVYFECARCKGRIDEDAKAGLVAAAVWIPTAIGTPGIVSQHINDLYSSDDNSTWGAIVLEYLDAKKEGRKELQGFYNHRLGLPWSDQAQKTDAADIRGNIAGRTLYRLEVPPNEKERFPRIHVFESQPAAETFQAQLRARGLEIPLETSACPPYKRGTIPFVPAGFFLGCDVGGNYAKWSVAALAKGFRDLAVIDWGTELDPDAVADLFRTQLWTCSVDGKEYRLTGGWMDAKFRKTDALRACLSVPGRRLQPAAGLGGASARNVKVFAESQIQGWPQGFKRLDFNDREAKDEFYLDRIKSKKRRIWFPVDVEEDPDFIAELTAEELIEDKNAGGKLIWNPFPPPNHYGDTVKLLTIGARFLTRRIATRPPREPAPVTTPEPEEV